MALLFFDRSMSLDDVASREIPAVLEHYEKIMGEKGRRVVLSMGSGKGFFDIVRTRKLLEVVIEGEERREEKTK